jgi:hypothetical protein
VTSHIVLMGGDEGSPREPDTRCDACGAVGTVGRATRYEQPPRHWRFCSACWPRERARLEAEWESESERWQHRVVHGPADLGGSAPPAYAFDSRVWADVAHFLDLIEQPAQPGQPGPRLADLEEIAADLRRVEPDMDGPPPPRVAAFLRRYGAQPS